MPAKMERPAKEVHLAQAGLADIPKEWDVMEVGELIAEDRGVSVGVMYPGEHDPLGIPLIKVGDMKGSIINPHPEYRISPEVHKEYRRTELEGGELLLTLVGGLGQCAVVPESMAGWNAARAVAVVRLKDQSDARFLRLCLLSEPLQHLINAWANTTVQATLNLKEVRQLPVPWPPKNERDTLAQIVGALDDKIELNRRMNETLEALAQGLFKSWFVDATQSALSKGWREVPLPQAIEVNPPRPLGKGAMAPYLDIANMPTRSARALKVIDREFGSGMRFKNGDTLVARITPCLENGKTCFVDLLKDGQVAWGSTEYIVMQPKPPLPPEFGYFLARTEEFRAFMISNMTGTTGRQRVPAECLSNFKLAVPPAEFAEKFGQFASAAFAQMKAHDEESRTLAALRDALLPKLLSGELRVPVTAQKW
jgi:type I restriction enzyme S subunit